MKNKNFKNGIIFGTALLFITAGFVSAYQDEVFNRGSHDGELLVSDGYTNLIEHQYGIDLFSIKKYRVMENPIRLRDLDEPSNNLPIDLIDTPVEFTWTSDDGKDWTTCAKNQENCGSCWLFGSMGALESVINIREECADLNPDLSEQYVLSCLPLAGSCNGGNVERCAYYYIMNTSDEGNYANGVITEDSFSYQSSFDYIPPCSDKPPDWEDFLIPISDYWESWPNLDDPFLKDTIKSLIYQKGPLMAYFWASERFIRWGTIVKDSSKYYPDYNEDCPHYVNHAMTIVGWKDDSSITNGGYWICKNTWGPNWGYNGFFNIEYDCLNLGGFIAWVDYDPDSYDWPPVANTGGFYQGITGEEIIFDSSQSVDAEDTIATYEWDFGDGTNASGLVVSHIYSVKGVYPVTLSVTDSIGQVTSQTTLVGVDEDPLSVEISGGLGLKIGFTNPVDADLKNINYQIEMKGFILPNKIAGIYQSIPADTQTETTINIYGIGLGSAKISINGYTATTGFFILGPFVKIINVF